MFFHCDSLKSIDLSKLETQTLSDVGSIFCCCSSLEYLDISGLNLANLKDSTNMFYKTGNLKYVDLSNVIDDDKYISQSHLNEIDKLFVCQKKI
jgi:surface protein